MDLFGCTGYHSAVLHGTRTLGCFAGKALMFLQLFLNSVITVNLHLVAVFFLLVQQTNRDFNRVPYALSYRIISRACCTRGKWKPKQAPFTLTFSVSTGIKLNRERSYFLCVCVSLEDRQQLSVDEQRGMMMPATIGWRPLLTSLVAIEPE